MSGITVLYRITLCNVIVFGISNGLQLKPNETEAKMFAQQTSEKVFNILDEVADATFDDNYDYKGAVRNFSQFVTEIVKEAKDFDYLNFKDEDLKGAFIEISYLAGDVIIGFERFWELMSAPTDLENMVEMEIIEKYQESSVLWPDVKKVFAESNNPDELMHYWLEWRKQSKEKCKEVLNISLLGLDDAANLNNMSSLEYFIRDYNFTEIENIMTDIQPLYREIHAFVRHQLWKKYGSSVVKPNGVIPDHLFQQVLAQIWKNNSIVEELYPHESLPTYDSILKTRSELGTLPRVVDEFYEKLGFTPFPEKYWGNRIRINKYEERDETDCKTTASYNTPNVYLEYCNKMDFQKFINLYGEMGKIYYAKEMTGLPAYSFNTHDLEYSIGKAVTLSASTFKNLKAVGMIVNFNITDEVEMNRLLRMSIHTFLSLPLEFVQVKLMVDLLSKEVDLKQINNHYWDLVRKYVGVGPPEERESDSLDLPISFYTDFGGQSTEFDLIVLGHQIYKRLCEISGKYPTEALHKCEIHGNKGVGEALRKMMRLGTSKPFEKVLGTMFLEDPAIKAEGLLEYFDPIKKLVTKKNQEDKLNIGW